MNATNRVVTARFHPIFFLCFLPSCITPSHSAENGVDSKLRVVVTTDGEVDDRCSMVRFLLYANEWDIRGLIHSSSKHHWKGDDTHPAYRWEGTEWLDGQLDAYEQIYRNLILHDPEFPNPDYLRAQISVGNIDYEGEMTKRTPGSNRIVAVLLEKDPSPVWLQAWGGPNTIARALKTIQEDHPDRMEEVSRKTKIYLISHQDETCKEYIRKEWPEVEVLLCLGKTYGAIAYDWEKFQAPDVKEYFGKKWMIENILKDHGPLCALYETKNDRFRSEGDSPAFLYLIETGLRSAERPTFGGWGGRFRRAGDHYWKSVDGEGVTPHSLLRWAIDFQNDWAARADWCVRSYSGANHPPIAPSDKNLVRTVKPGERIELSAEGWIDPDGDDLSFGWFQFDEADTASSVSIKESPSARAVWFDVPEEPGKDIHLIMEVVDDGTPPLKCWQRIVFNIEE